MLSHLGRYDVLHLLSQLMRYAITISMMHYAILHGQLMRYAIMVSMMHYAFPASWCATPSRSA